MLRRHRTGNTTLESALVLLVFLFVLFGIADFGQLFFLHHTLMERARAAARAGAVDGYTDAEVVNMVMYGSRTTQPGPGAFGLTSSNVQVSRTGSDYDARVTVTVSNLAYKSFSPLIGGYLTNLPVRVVVSSEAP